MDIIIARNFFNLVNIIIIIIIDQGDVLIEIERLSCSNLLKCIKSLVLSCTCESHLRSFMALVLLNLDLIIFAMIVIYYLFRKVIISCLCCFHLYNY